MERNKKNNSTSAGSANNSLLLRDANIVLPNHVVARGSLLINNGQIAALHDSTEQCELSAFKTLELRGLSLFPGFIDVHIHGSVAIDTMDATANELGTISRFLATQGVTGWLPTLVPGPATDYENAVRSIEVAMKEQASERDSDQLQSGARILGVHYEGPFVNTSQCGALRSSYFKSFSSASVLDSLPTPGAVGSVRMMTVAPEIEGGVELIRELVARGWIVSMGHTRAGSEILDQAFAAGARHMTHFMNAMPQLHHRAPGPVGWGLAKKDVTVDLIADGIHVDPLVLQVVLQAKGPEGVALISDAIAAAGSGDGDYEIWGETISVKSGRTSNARGSIAGSVITMLDAVRMMGSLGFSELQIAKMASTNPARLLGIDQRFGSIEVGKHADLVALDQEGNVRIAMVAGQVLTAPAG